MKHIFWKFEIEVMSGQWPRVILVKTCIKTLPKKKRGLLRVILKPFVAASLYFVTFHYIHFGVLSPNFRKFCWSQASPGPHKVGHIRRSRSSQSPIVNQWGIQHASCHLNVARAIYFSEHAHPPGHVHKDCLFQIRSNLGNRSRRFGWNQLFPQNVT